MSSKNTTNAVPVDGIIMRQRKFSVEFYGGKLGDMLKAVQSWVDQHGDGVL